ncbi:hypothetical protein CTAYLR_003361 [Chrysophaeum taylorii]|uniref:Thioredoxin domain-containing protein n=1 Tax=Chrysophaeum taylorii TaxID=2483200 RepID=A0AAD7UGH2_9STRA|nr:hypothetical protein CTAYLR_003361 [Chrysophaeum taylorii]
MVRIISIFLCVVVASGDENLLLTKENLDWVVSGRAVMLQFTVEHEGCGACNESRAKWQQLALEFKQSREVMIGRVVCDASQGGEALCDDVLDNDPLATYPSVWYGSPFALRRYYGGKSFEDMAAVAAMLRAPCSPWRRDRCDPEALAELDAYLNLDDRDLNEIVVTTQISVREKLNSIDNHFDKKRDDVLRQLDAYEVLATVEVERIITSIEAARTVVRTRKALDPSTPVHDLLDDSAWARPGEAYSDDDLMPRFTYYDDEDVEPLYEDEYYNRHPDDIYAQAREYADAYVDPEDLGFSPADSSYED